MKITLQYSISKRIWNIHCWAIRVPTSSHGRDQAPDAKFHTVTVKRDQLSPNMFFISLLFSIDTI